MRLLVSILIVIATVLGLSKGNDPQASQNQTPVVVNETEALKVESLTTEVAHPELGGIRYILNLKNVSNKKIIRVAIEQPNGGVNSAEYTPGGGWFLPGAVKRIEMTDYSETQPKATVSQPKQIIIRLAMFEDGSSEGDFKTHERFANRYRGRTTQLRRINAILEEAVATSKDLTKVTSQISALPDEAPPGEDKAIGEGFVEVKQDTLRLLNILMEWERTSKVNPNAARNILQQNADLVGISSSEEGMTRIIKFNQRLVERSGNR